ncbi:unnamed protein product [Candidula unifasciata]|uniref:Uncharacterized protein n=1 Tax=Candidula unifasciata TaxID=100452 RepID=A0A8S3Z9S3_9EUPU|nr:unnamed protein product [Candidula unifasciata]
MRCCGAVEIHHKCVDEVSLEGKEIKNTIVITFAFQVVFTAFNALQNLHSSLHDEESLGNISLAILYGTAILSSILSPTVIGLIGAKTAIVASFAAHCIYVLANFYPSFTTMAPAAVALGAFHGPAWTSQALYISACAFSFSKSSSASPYTVLSRFNGFFFAVFATAQIVGNLVTSTIIRDGIANDTDDTVKFCGPQDCPHHENSTIEDPEEWVIDITLGFLMACALLGLGLVIFLLSPLPRSDWIQRVSVRDTATSCFKVLMSVNMMLLVPLIFFTAAEHAFLITAYTKSYVACPIGIHMVGYVMAVYGATTPAFVYIFSHLARIAGRFLLLMLSLLTHIFLFIVLFRWTPTADEKAVIFIIPIVWGVSESILQAQANALIAMLFPTQKEPAFANFHAWRSLGYAITFLNASYLCVSTKLIVCMTFAGLGTVLYVILEFKSKNHLSFDRVELADIINEAQQGWRRDEKGLTLEINKVMSLEHLAGSKATSWHHAGPIMYDYMDSVKSRSVSRTNLLPHSMSDGHLLYAAAKVDAELEKIQNERVQKTAGKNRSKSESCSSKKHNSDTNSHSFYAIPEVSYEDECPMKTGERFFLPDADDDSSSSNNQEDDIDEDEAQRIRDYRKVIRRLSETPANESFTMNNMEIETVDEESLASAGLDNPAFESEENDFNADGDIVFTLGATSPSINGGATFFESDDCAIQNYGVKTRPGDTNSFSGINRLMSDDQGYLSANGSDMCSPVDSVNKSLKSVLNTTSPKSTKKNSKDKRFRVFKGLRNSKKRDKEGKCNSESVSMNDKAQSGGNDNDEQDNHSDADSDGFVDEELDNNKSSVAFDITDVDKTKKKGFIPINETEDVNCIY